MEAHIKCLCLVAFLLFSTVSSEMNWQNGEENGEATLVCPIETKMQWVTPNKLAVQPNGYDAKKYKFDVYNESILIVMNLNASDAGTYICGIPIDETEQVQVRQIELHVKLPYHDSYYGDNAITGVVVAVIVAMLFGGSCLLYKYRYKEKSFTDMEVVTVDPSMKSQKEKQDMKTDSSPILESRSIKEGCENPAMDRDSDDESGMKNESLGLRSVTAEEGHKGSRETAETGM